MKGKDLKQPNNKITLGDKEFALNYDMNALELIEDYYGSVDDGFKELFNGSIKSTKVLIWIGINSGREELISMQEIGSLIRITEVAKVKEYVINCFFDAMPEEKEKEKKWITQVVSLIGRGFTMLVYR